MNVVQLIRGEDDQIGRLKYLLAVSRYIGNAGRPLAVGGKLDADDLGIDPVLEVGFPLERGKYAGLR